MLETVLDGLKHYEVYAVVDDRAVNVNRRMVRGPYRRWRERRASVQRRSAQPGGQFGDSELSGSHPAPTAADCLTPLSTTLPFSLIDKTISVSSLITINELS